MNIWFVADVHLKARPLEPPAQFLSLLENIREKAGAGIPQHLVLGGDVFEFWFDRVNLMERSYHSVLSEFRELTKAGCVISALDGNHDFGYGAAFTELTGGRACGEFLKISQNGRQALVMHGDQLLTADTRYQSYKRFIRSRPLRFLGRNMPDFLLRLSVRRLEIMSRRECAVKPKSAFAVDTLEAARLAATEDTDFVFCGHVHAPRVESILQHDRRCELFVVGDWDKQGGIILTWPENEDPTLVSWPPS